MSTYTIGQSLGLDDGNGSSGIDDTMCYILISVICCFCVISSIMVISMMRGGSASGSSGVDGAGGGNADIISAIAAANQTKLPVTINLTTSPQYYPK
jgi:hypothetical protein